MPENILVVEYEPRYTDRVRQALAGQPFVPAFAKDGEEALRVLDEQPPRLIVLSSVVPKISTAELIRMIRGRGPLATTPILLTVSGYTGKSPKADAQRLGASDILPKPYSESEFLGKVQQMLGVRGDATGKTWAPELDPEFTVRPQTLPGITEGQLTSNEIFGDLLDDDRPATGARKNMKPKDDVDKMLADTLAGVMPSQKKKDPPTAPQSAVATPAAAAPRPQPVPPPAQTAAPDRPRTQAQSQQLDKLLNDTLSGIDKQSRPRPTPVAPPPAPPRPAPAPPVAKPAAAAAPAAAAKPKFDTARMQAVAVEKMPIAQPVLAPKPGPEQEDEAKDGVKFGQYVLLEKIATGGMAEVWKARMRGVEGFQKIVAIKKILPHLSDNQDFIEMFIDEAKLAAQLNHNNIIHIYDLGKIQSSYYIAMEYIDGHDLKTILRRGEERGQPMQVELALFIASKIASALDYAHRKRDYEDKDLGLVHRDVSPQNVLVSQDGDIKLCDFGIAKAASKASHTQAGALKGKLQYMSPEQAWGRHIDKRSDIFALATVLFEMLTGRKLFTGDNELSILEQVREARVATPSEQNEEVTPEIDRIVQKALQKDAANRYQTAGEMARDLDAVLYSFKPTPTSADLAIYMHRIWSPDLDTTQIDEHPAPAPVPPVHHAPAPAAPAPVQHAPAPAPAHAAATPVFIGDQAEEKKLPIVPIAIAAVVVIALAIGWFVMRKPSAATTSTTVATTSAARTAAPNTASALPLTASTGSAASSTQPTLDSSKVDAEVQKRLAADRAKLDAQARAQQPGAAVPPPAQRPVPTQVAQATPPPVPAPAPAQTAPVPAPVQQQAAPPAPVQQAPAPAPAQEQPAAARAREGDLVAAGTEGLTPAKMLRRGSVPYPPMAKLQHVEGTIILSALVGENGRVLDVKVLRGSPRGVGLNEAAEDIVRRSTFSPPTKDGVKVKSWTTVPVDFKL
jgi:TonB family protein